MAGESGRAMGPYYCRLIDTRCRPRRKEERDGQCSLDISLVYQGADLSTFLEVHAPGLINSGRATPVTIIVIERERAGLDDNDDRTRMGVPP